MVTTKLTATERSRLVVASEGRREEGATEKMDL
jgi:hypothetical protein